jgi:hypothetical protein
MLPLNLMLICVRRCCKYSSFGFWISRAIERKYTDVS